MSAHLDAPAYNARACPVPPAPVDATAELRRHTQGPWRYGVRPDGSMWLSIGDPTKTHYQGDLCASEVDAKLIANAPKLLAALAQERANHAFTLAALRAVIDRIDLFFPMPAEHVTPGSPLALARSALEQFEGVS